MDSYSPRRKIFIVANSFWNLFNFRSGLIKALIDQGFEVTALAKVDEHLKAVENLGCAAISINFKANGMNPFMDISLWVKLTFLMSKHKPNCALFFTAKPNIYGSLAATFCGVPYINNISGLGSVFIKQGLLSKFMGFLYKVSLSKTYRVFFQNSEDQSLFQKRNYVKSLVAEILPGSGVDLERFKPNQKNPNQSRNPFSFILIARLLRDKGIYEYIEAASIVHEQYPHVIFKVLGFLGVENPTAISKEQMDEWIENNYLKYLGHAEDVRPFIEESHCVVLPSYREGTPRTLLEAAAMGRPIITTDVPGCNRVINDGLTGFLCEVKNAQDLAQKMISMICLADKDRALMGLKGREKMELEFNEQLVIDQYLKAIHEICSK